MEENEKPVEDSVVNDTTSENVGGTKSKTTKIIICAVVVIIAIVVVFNVFFNTKGKAKSVVKDYIKAFSKVDVKKMIKLQDPYGSYVFNKLSKDDYDDFWEEYQEFVKEKDDDYDEVKESYEESLEKDEIDDVKDEIKDYLEDEDISIKFKSISSVKKEGKNLFRVKAKVEFKKDDEKKTKTLTFYVMKKGLSCYIVDEEFLYTVASL